MIGWFKISESRVQPCLHFYNIKNTYINSQLWSDADFLQGRVVIWTETNNIIGAGLILNNLYNIERSFCWVLNKSLPFVCVEYL